MDWSALCKQSRLAVRLPVPWEHLMVVMRAALCVYPCFLFLLWALRYLRIKDSEMPRKRLWSTTHLESPGSVEPRIPRHIFSTAHQWLLNNQVTAIYPTCIPLPVVALVISWYLLCHLKVPWYCAPKFSSQEFQTRQSDDCVCLSELGSETDPSPEVFATRLTLPPGWMKGWTQLEALTKGLFCPEYVASCRMLSLCQLASFYLLHKCRAGY